MNCFSYISEAHAAGRKLLAVLLDPEKADQQPLAQLAHGADLLFVGGSTGSDAEPLVNQLHLLTNKPVILFPGQIAQFTPQADALLFLSVLSSRNPEMLIGRQVRAAQQVKQSGIETIAMGYILIDGGCPTSVAAASQSAPIPADNLELIISTAIAAEMMGMQVIYLEAGSGAQTPIAADTIAAVRAAVQLPLIVGGGIRTKEGVQTALSAGADIVVVGNHLELHPEDINLLKIHP